MRAVLVSHSDLAGGAARAAYRVHRALQEESIDSQLWVRRKLSHDDDVHRIGRIPHWGRLAKRLNRRVQSLQHTDNQVLHSSNPLPTRVSSRIPRADVVNLHWIGDGTMSIADVARLHPPVVMTLHDMWGFCGAEHYVSPEKDLRWAVGYTRGTRPDGHSGLDIDRWTWERKQRHWAPMIVISPSTWLADRARDSALMRNWPVHVVPYPIDVSVFRPRGRDSVRQSLGLAREAKVVLFGAAGGTSDPRKGFDLLTQALRHDTLDRDVVLLVFGQDEPSATVAGRPVRWIGTVHENRLLAELYSAADVVVVPSRQDNLPQVGIEAQACGTPVVAFNTAGLPDVVCHRETGYLAQPFSPIDLAKGISWVFEDERRRQALSKAARERAVRLWHPTVVARQYLEVFQVAMAPPSWRI